MSQGLGEFVGKLKGAEKALKDGQRTAMVQAGQVARGAFLGAPGAPHRVAGRPTTVSARAVNRGPDAGVAVRWNGPAHLVNNPTAAHDIRPKQFVGTRGTGKKAQRGAALMAAFGFDAHSSGGGVRLADGNIRGAVHHPGTKGKNFYERGRDAAIPLVAAAYRRSTHTTLARFFSG